LSISRLAHLIHQRTDGNPLFMVNVTNELVAREVVINRDGRWEVKGTIADDGMRVPENLRQLIEQQLARVTTDERKILEAASVAGAEFSAAAVAAGTEQTTEAVETHCDGLARREQFLRTQGTSEWPDGTIAARYGFVHALYQEVVYEQISATRRSRLHRQIGEREEQAYGDRAREIAAGLAVHFERGRDYRRAIRYLQQAGENASQRNAYIEAISLLTKELELLKTLPDTPERAQQELALQIALGSVLIATKGYAAPEVERSYARALELCRQMEATPQLYLSLWGLHSVSFVRAEFQTAYELAEQLLTLAKSGQDQALLPQAYRALGTTLYMLGELVPAREHLEQSLAWYDSQKHPITVLLYLKDRGADSRSYAAWVLWHLGYPDQALKKSRETQTLAQELSHPFTVAFVLDCAARLHQLRREREAVKERAEAGIALSSEHGFPFWLARGTILQGWALAEQGKVEEGIAQMRQGLAAHRATGAEMNRPEYLARLAEAYGKGEQAEEGLNVLAEALRVVDKTGERVYEAELYRLKGQLTLQKFQVSGSKFQVENSLGSSVQSLESEAEECFLKALEIARQQQAKSLELRAAMSLSRLWQQQGKKDEARQLLAEVYGWFTEGFDTKDLQEAKVLLEELA